MIGQAGLTYYDQRQDISEARAAMLKEYKLGRIAHGSGFDSRPSVLTKTVVAPICRLIHARQLEQWTFSERACEWRQGYSTIGER